MPGIEPTPADERTPGFLGYPQSERYFQELAENIREVFCISSPDWSKVFYVSPAYERIWGRSCQSLRDNPLSWLDAIVADDHERVERVLARRASGDFTDPAVIEYRIRRPDGAVRWIASRVFPVCDEHGRIYRLFRIAEDVTIRKGAENALIERQAELDAVFHNSPTSLLLVDQQKKVRHSNLNDREMMWKHGVGSRLRCVHSLAEPGGCGFGGKCQECLVRLRILDALETGAAHHCEELQLCVLREDREETATVLVTVVPVYIKHERWALLSLQDITDMRRTEHALQQSESLLRSFFNSPGALRGIVELRDDDILHIADNEAAAEFFGCSVQTMKESLESALGTPRDVIRMWLGYYRECLRSGQPVHFEYLHKTAARERWLSASIGCVGAGPDGVHRFVYAVTDITGRKNADLQLAANQEQLRSLASELSLAEERERRRLASLLHDRIGQNLALCRIKLEMVESELGKGTPLSESINSVLDTLRGVIADTRSLTFELSPPVLYEVGLDAALKSLALSMQRQSGITCVFFTEGAAEEISLDLRSLLYQAARELVMNAVKHSHANEIMIALRYFAAHVQLSVRDDGQGLPQDKPQEPSESLSYGLFSLRERLRHFDGMCELSSLPGEGTLIVITVPAGNG